MDHFDRSDAVQHSLDVQSTVESPEKDATSQLPVVKDDKNESRSNKGEDGDKEKKEEGAASFTSFFVSNLCLC